jgi:hypothetical protein
MPETEAPVFTPREWKARLDAAVLGAYEADGLGAKDEDGNLVRDRGAMRQRIDDILIEDSVCESVNARNNEAITDVALAHRLFPSVDWDHDEDDLSDFDLEVRKTLISEVWNECDLGESKPLQKLVGLHEEGFIMVKATPVQGKRVVYLTTSEDLIFGDLIKPVQDAVDRAAARLGKQLAMVGIRQKELARRASDTIDKTVKSASGTAKTAMGELVAKSETEKQ